MSYSEITVVIDGAVDSDSEITTYEELEAIRIAERDAWVGHKQPVEIFELVHDHESGLDCECAQFAQDHRPIITFGVSA